MAVRVNKGSFNIREKLTELGRRFGLKGSELAAAETVQDARDLVSAGRKNLIINGDMRIAERGTSFAVAASGAYGVDRWKYEASTNAQVTVSQNTAWNNGPYWAHSLKVETTTARSSTTSSNFAQFLYHIEANDFGRFRFGTSEAKPFTFSFWVKSNKTGKFPASFQNHDGTRVFPSDYTIKTADTWEKKVIVVPGDSNGSWNLYGNSTGLRFTLMWTMGSNFTGGTKGAWASTSGYANLTTCAGDQMDVVGATLEFAHAQLEVGKNATEFEHRSYAEELALCQRYYYKHAEGNLKDLGTGHYYATTLFAFSVHFPVTMRIPPNLDYETGTGYYGIYSAGLLDAFDVMAITRKNNNSAAIDTGTGTNGAVGNGGIVTTNNADAYFAFDAELT